MNEPGANEPQCPRCGDLLHPIFQGADHSLELCKYRQRVANLKAEEWEIIAEDDDTRPLLTAKFLPVLVFKYPIDPTNPQQGYIKSIYLPKWLKNSVIQYYQFQWRNSMTLVEYLEKMHK